MSPTLPKFIQDLLSQHGQAHVVETWRRLAADQRSRLKSQLEQLDLPNLLPAIHHVRTTPQPTKSPNSQLDTLAPPRSIVPLPTSSEEFQLIANAHTLGQNLLNRGHVGCILVAGGQGTRLGFDQPKGMFPIGPVSQKSLFQLHFEQVRARSLASGQRIPYFIMTSDATHTDTAAFLEENRYFGLPKSDVYLFKQGTLPSVCADTGRLLLDSSSQLILSPDGHGGLLAALHSHQLLEVMRDRGIHLLYYHQVDNPSAIICDPVFLGLHALHRSELSTKVVRKTQPLERVGLLCDLDGKTQVIEYSDLPEHLAHQRDEQGQLRFWAGSTAIHIFSRSLFERLLAANWQLPLHTALKKVPHRDASGTWIDPPTPNAIKFERFIFDILPQAENPLVVEADRPREFNPVKNAEGYDSPHTSRSALISLHRRWLSAAGHVVDDNATVEISPLRSLEGENLADLTHLPQPIAGQHYIE